MPIDNNDERIRKLESERDAYLNALYAITRKDVPPLTVDEVQELQKATCSLSEAIEEIKRELGPANG